MLTDLTSKRISRTIIAIKIVIICFLSYKLYNKIQAGYDLSLDNEFLLFLTIGFLAELIDGSIGMAYGIACSTTMLFFGIPPAMISAGVHTAEVFTTGVSGLSHLHFRNFDKNLFIRLVVPGIIGSALGAYLLSDVLDGSKLKPFISLYLLFIGLKIIWHELRKNKNMVPFKNIRLLGFAGGALDAIGGGGWGPMVTSTLISKGSNPRHTIGTVNTTEFFVTFASSIVFIIFIGIDSWKIILGLIVGGILAAPLGAYIVKNVRHNVLMYLVGILVALISAASLFKNISDYFINK